MRTVIRVLIVAVLVLVSRPLQSVSITRCVGPGEKLLFTDKPECPEGFTKESTIQPSTPSPHNEAAPSEGSSPRDGFGMTEADKQEIAVEYRQIMEDLLSAFDAGDLAQVERFSREATEIWMLLNSYYPSLLPSLATSGAQTPLGCIAAFQAALRAKDKRALVMIIHPVRWSSQLPFLMELSGKWDEVADSFNNATVLKVEDNRAVCEVVRHTTIEDFSGNLAFEVIVVKNPGGDWKLAEF